MSDVAITKIRVAGAGVRQDLSVNVALRVEVGNKRKRNTVKVGNFRIVWYK